LSRFQQKPIKYLKTIKILKKKKPQKKVKHLSQIYRARMHGSTKKRLGLQGLVRLGPRP
jgi:hypothetical protein